jgi:ribosomally synthesized peptide (Cys-rich family)
MKQFFIKNNAKSRNDIKGFICDPNCATQCVGNCRTGCYGGCDSGCSNTCVGRCTGSLII